MHSLPGATAKLFLDFDGDPAQSWAGYNVPVTPAFDLDGDATTFSTQELAVIQEVWARVAEMYSPFNLDVTTVDPGNRNHLETAQVVIGGNGAWYGGGQGGTSQIMGFDFDWIPNTAYVFPSLLGNNTKIIAIGAGHEAGHMFALNHQSVFSGEDKTQEYNPGTPDAAPIMGMSYYSTRGLWWTGTSSVSSAVIQDDMANISGVLNGFGFRTDDYGNNSGSAYSLTPAGGSVSASGVITQSSDSDWFSFSTSGGAVNFTGVVAAYGAMLDLKLSLYSGAGALISTSDTASLGESLSATLSAGTYYIVVSSHGNYGDVGQYTLSGTIGGGLSAPVANIGGPYNVSEGGTVQLSGAGSTGTSLTYTWDLDNDGIYGETGASATRGNETGVTPTFNAAGLDGPGTYTVHLKVTDGSSQTDTDSIAITLQNVAPTLTISGNNSVNEGSTYTLNLSATDPGQDTIAGWSIDWGDGHSDIINGAPSSKTHVYADNGPYTISATATDGDGTYSSNTKSVTVADVPPTLAIGGNSSVLAGAVYTLNLSNSDPGDDTIVSWTIHWGDGDTDVINGNPSTATHTYQAGGSDCTISATATNEDGTFAANDLEISTIDPDSDSVSPTASLNTAANVAASGGATYTFKINYADDVGLDTSSFDDSDVLVTGPNGFSQLASFVSVVNSDGSHSVVTYQITTPGGHWDPVDNGTYHIALQTGEVSDTSTNAADAATLGSFQVFVLAADATGNTTKTARNLGGFSPGVIRNTDEGVNALDRMDYFKFNVATPVSLSAKLYFMTSAVNLTLLDGAGKQIAPTKTTATSQQYDNTVLKAGTYYCRVNYTGALGTTYRLHLQTAVLAAPSTALKGAIDLGLIGRHANRSVSNSISATNAVDYFKFQTKVSIKLALKLSGLTDDANLELLDQSGHVITSSTQAGTADENLSATLSASIYYVRVLYAGTHATNYHLGLTTA